MQPLQRRRTLSRDVTMIINHLPNETECRRVRHLVFRDADNPITEDQLLAVLPLCIRIETIILCGVRDVTDRAVLLASTLSELQGLDLTGCIGVTDAGILELTNGLRSLQWLRLNAIPGLTDASISAIAKSCPRLTELEISHLPLLTAVSVRDLWTYLRQLKCLKLESCPLLTDRAFPSMLHTAEESISAEKPLPSLPELESLLPLHLTHTAEDLRELDLQYCPNVTDDVVGGIVAHAPKLQTWMLSGCTGLTDRAIGSICQLGDHLEVLTLAHLSHITDRAIMKLARSCTHLRTLNIDCENDMCLVKTVIASDADYVDSLS
jgi:F-box and leucine-rich repeat protein GRR1